MHDVWLFASVSVPLPVYMSFREACYSIQNADLPSLGDIIRHVDTKQSISIVNWLARNKIGLGRLGIRILLFRSFRLPYKFRLIKWLANFTYLLYSTLLHLPPHRFHSAVPTDAGIEPRTVATVGAFAVRRSNHYLDLIRKARSHARAESHFRCT